MQLGVFISLVPKCPKQKRMHCFWASGLLVQQQAYLYDTCNLNIQTDYQKENADACFFFFFLHWILAVCDVYWIFKTVYLTFFNNTGDSPMVLEKNFASSPVFLTFVLHSAFLPHPHSFQWPQEWLALHCPHFVNCSAYKLRVECFTLIIRENHIPKIVCIYVINSTT